MVYYLRSGFIWWISLLVIHIQQPLRRVLKFVEHTKSVSIYKIFEKFNSRLRVRRENRLKIFGWLGVRFSFPTSKARRCNCGPNVTLTFEPLKKRCSFPTGWFTIELELVESDMFNPPWPELQKKSDENQSIWAKGKLYTF